MGTTNLKFAVGDHIDFLTYLNILVIDIFKGNYELMDGSGKRKKVNSKYVDASANLHNPNNINSLNITLFYFNEI